MASEEKEDEKLPLISYRKLKTNDREELDRLRFALVDGEHGFFQLDVDDEVDEFDQVAATEKRATFGKDIKRVYEMGKKFLKDLNEDTKKQYLHTQYETFETGGYIPLFEEYAYKANEIACVESFDLVRDISEEEEEEDENKTDFMKQPSGARGRIDWPIEVPEMKGAFNRFYQKCDEIARILFCSFAKALSMQNERAFEKHFSRDSHCAMRFMRYPQVTQIDDKNSKDADDDDKNNNNNNNTNNNNNAKEVGVSEHTDFEMMTFLHQNECGLYVKKRKGEWMAAPTLREDEAKLLVIISDGLEVFTNGMYKATPHRVERPENKERFSIVRFNGVNAETEMYALPEFVGNNDGANKRKRGKATTITQLDLITTKVEEADGNLKDLVKRKKHPKEALSSNPERFAQLLLMAKDYDNQWYICLVLHKSGEFAERYTGFIGKVETWYEKNALAETCIFAACEALEEITLPENAKTRVTEKARFRFHGWLQENKMAIEHECVLVLNNAREKEAVLKDFNVDACAKDLSVIPKWFKVEDIPYAEMPEDDMHWYPMVIQNVKENEKKDDIIHGGYFTFDNDVLKDFEIKTYPKVSSS